jgi:hypothetical protein
MVEGDTTPYTAVMATPLRYDDTVAPVAVKHDGVVGVPLEYHFMSEARGLLWTDPFFGQDAGVIAVLTLTIANQKLRTVETI